MLSELNPQQKAAVEVEENALIIACPGSGKTRVLTRKIALEIERNNSKKYVVALTYTNRAADEINKRINEIGIVPEKLWVGTIHSFCYQWILKPYAGYLEELKDGFSITDEFEVEDLKSKLREEFGLNHYENINTSMSREGMYVNDIDIVNEVAKELHRRILNNRQIDFDLVLYYSYKLLTRYPKITRHLSRMISLILIDEFQDTQDLQYAIVGEIIKKSEEKCRLFLVGDPDQAIYGSLGGIAKSKIDIEKEIGGREIKLLGLEGNYRSTQRIIDFYKSFQSTDIEIKSMNDYSELRGNVTFNKTIQKNDIYREIVEIIKVNIQNGVKANEICIIAPRWEFLVSMARKLNALLPDIPFDAPGLTPLPRYIDNFWYKLTRLLLTDSIVNLYLVRMRWCKEIIEEINNLTNLNYSSESDDCRKLLKLMRRIKTSEEDGILYLKSIFLLVFESMDINLKLYPTLLVSWEYFFAGINKRYELEEFKDTPRNIEYFKSMFKPSNGVVVNTCYGVKGEEFETVIAFGLLWGYLPHWNSIIKKPYSNAKNDSNKLLYVIGSRAKRNLHLFAEQGRYTVNRNPYEINHQLKHSDFEFDI